MSMLASMQGAALILSHRTANACYKDAADLHAELENYPQAIARYEQVANGSLSSALTKYSVKEYWLRASLCALAMGVRSSFVRVLDAGAHVVYTSRTTGHRYSQAKLVQVLFPRYHIPFDSRSEVRQRTH